ncbi:hypothetical protein BJY52DRAFT_1196074 [Lactarius psammicola]|nr:hypothetical protein BJY52DRAFT_1196074 [Lactarius psammicola]
MSPLVRKHTATEYPSLDWTLPALRQIDVGGADAPDVLLAVDCLPLGDSNTPSAHDADRSRDTADTTAVVMADLRAEDVLWDCLEG